MPIIGTIASSIRSAQPIISEVYESIATVSVGSGGVNTITFSSIPSTYRHLQVRGYAKSFTNTAGGSPGFRFNSDTGSNYAVHYMGGPGTTAFQGGVAGEARFVMGVGTQSLTNPASYIVDIFDYADTNKYKTVRIFSGLDENGSGIVNFESGVWLNTNAVNTITFNTQANQPDNRYTQFTLFALYGIRSA